MIRRLYLRILRDIVAGQCLAALQAARQDEFMRIVQHGEKVGDAMARRAYEVADYLIKHKEQEQ